MISTLDGHGGFKPRQLKTLVAWRNPREVERAMLSEIKRGHLHYAET